MEIINHYKNEVNKSLLTLCNQNIIAQQQSLESQQSTEPSQSSDNSILISSTNPNNTSQRLSINPYKATLKPDHLPKLTRCVACSKSGKYRCPQCLKPYCSSAHFKSHNLFCSQSFYKRQVQSQMKSLKSTKNQQQQVRQMLKQHNQAKEQDTHLKIMSEERLIELLDIIQRCEKEGKEVEIDLREQERQKLTEFIKQMQQGSINNQSNDSNHYHNTQSLQNSTLLQTIIQPYWLIPDGLDYYFMQQLQIQQFSESAHLSLIINRQSLAKKYRTEIKLLHELTKIKPSPLIREEILQYLVIWVLVNLAWGNDLNDKNQILMVMEKLYTLDLAKNIKENGIRDEEAGAYTLAKLKGNIAQIEAYDTRNLLKSWYKASAISSSKLITKNKFLLIQTLLRAQQFFQYIWHQASTLNQNQKHTKKRLNHAIKHVKKLQFLLSYVKDQLQIKIDSVSQTNHKDNLFRHIYRSLTQQEHNLVVKTQEQKDFTKQKNSFQQINKHGILFHEPQ